MQTRQQEAETLHEAATLVVVQLQVGNKGGSRLGQSHEFLDDGEAACAALVQSHSVDEFQQPVDPELQVL